MKIRGTVQSILNDTAHKGSVVLSQADATELARAYLRSSQPPDVMAGRTEKIIVLVNEEIQQLRDALWDAQGHYYENGRHYAERFNKHKIDAVNRLINKMHE